MTCHIIMMNGITHNFVYKKQGLHTDMIHFNINNSQTVNGRIRDVYEAMKYASFQWARAAFLCSFVDSVY